MMSVEAVRRLLAIADVGKDPYAVGEIAGELLRMNAADSAAAAHYARALGALNLHSAARRMLDGIGGAGVASGIVPWASRGRRFAANLAALEESNPQAAALVRAGAAELVDYELHQASDGNFQVLDTRAGAPLPLAWLGGLANHKAAEALWKFDRTTPQMVNPIAFDGLGFGWLFLEALRTTENSFLNYSCPIYVIERDPLALAILLHIHDLREVVRSPRLRLFVGQSGEEALSSFRSALTNRTTWTLPHIFIRCSMRAAAPLAIEECVTALQNERLAKRNAWIAQAADYYSAKDADYWRTRFRDAVEGSENHEPLRVLGITSRFTTVLQYSMAELREAVTASGGAARAGVEMKIAIEPDDESLENPFLEMIATFKPDLIVQISRMRYENPVMPANVPFLCWDQDNLPCMRTVEATKSLNELTFVAGHGAVFGYANLEWPRRNVIFHHAPAATLRYSGVVNAALTGKYTCDVSFVSNASATPQTMKNQQRNTWGRQERLLAIFDIVSQEIITGMDSSGGWEFTRLRDVVNSRAKEQSILLTEAAANEMTLSLMPIADRCFRHAALSWAKRWCDENGKSFRLYGKGWDRESAFAPHAAGPAGQGEELMAIYQSSRINLQLIESGFMHSRALDGLAAGGFFLTRRAFNDGDIEGIAAAHHRLGVIAEKMGLQTLASLDESTHPEVTANWNVVKRWYTNQPRSMELKTMAIWAATPGASMVFQDYWDISFESEADFGRLADKFLGDESLRQQISARMQSCVRNKFSYRSIWQHFLRNILTSLESAEVAIHA